MEHTGTEQILDYIIKDSLKPHVMKIDMEAYYAREYLVHLARSDHFHSAGLDAKKILGREVLAVGKTSETCMTTGFNLWCHLAALTYLRQTENEYLKQELLPKLENGETLGGTGLSNPMKYFSGLEPLHLQAVRVNDGYLINGNLASVSNLNEDHWFGIVASLGENEEIMAIVPCQAEGLTLKERSDYIGVNGSATYACKFNRVFVPDQWIISTDVKSFINRVYPTFVLYQIPLGLGVTSAAIQSMKKAPKKQDGINRYLDIQPEEVKQKYDALKKRLTFLIEKSDLKPYLKEIIQLRLDVANLAMEAVHGDMLHYGGAAYLKKSHPSRRLRESYFLLNLTPTVKHLEKLLSV